MRSWTSRSNRSKALVSVMGCRRGPRVKQDEEYTARRQIWRAEFVFLPLPGSIGLGAGVPVAAAPVLAEAQDVELALHAPEAFEMVLAPAQGHGRRQHVDDDECGDARDGRRVDVRVVERL